MKWKIWFVIVMGFAFTIGNATWIKFNEPKIMYIPLSLFLFSMLLFIKYNISGKVVTALIDFFLVLSLGNIVKQVTYKPGNQWMDYVWGGLVVSWLIYELWVIRKQMIFGKR